MTNKEYEKVNDVDSVICTRRDDLWVFVFDYLEMLEHTPTKIDKEFVALYKSLMDYVYGKIEIPESGREVIDSFHVVLQEI